MDQKLLNQAVELFDSNEKWESFLELTYNKDDIKNYLWKRFQSSMNDKFAKKDLVDEWSFCSENPKQYKWYLTDYGKDSVIILFDHGKNLSLWANPSKVNLEVIRKIINTQKFSMLMNFLDRIDSVGTIGHWEFISEHGNFCFGSPFDKNFPNDDRLTWYAAHRSVDFIEQITDKVNVLRKDKNMTTLLRELNEIGKKE